MTAVLTVQLPGPLIEVGPCTAVRRAEPGMRSGPDQGAVDAPCLHCEFRLSHAALLSARRALDQAAAAIRQLKEDALRDAESHLVDLAVEVAERVLVQEIEGGRAKAGPMVREALAQAGPWREAVVHLNPEDLAEIQAAAPAGAMPAFGTARLVADAAVRRAECRVVTGEGCVHTSVEDALEDVRRTLKGIA
jgi:flagellar biosynthesis/type III secretory pathway protein FliH